MWELRSLGGRLPTHGITQDSRVKRDPVERWRLAEDAHSRLTRLCSRGAVDKSAAEVKVRTVESSYPLELDALGWKEDLVDEHSDLLHCTPSHSHFVAKTQNP